MSIINRKDWRTWVFIVVPLVLLVLSVVTAVITLKSLREEKSDYLSACLTDIKTFEGRYQVQKDGFVFHQSSGYASLMNSSWLYPYAQVDLLRYGLVKRDKDDNFELNVAIKSRFNQIFYIEKGRFEGDNSSLHSMEFAGSDDLLYNSTKLTESFLVSDHNEQAIIVLREFNQEKNAVIYDITLLDFTPEKKRELKSLHSLQISLEDNPIVEYPVLIDWNEELGDFIGGFSRMG